MTDHRASSSWSTRPFDAIQAGLAYTRAAPMLLAGPLPGRPRLAIVGSRAAHRRVLATLRPLVAAAGARGWSLVSGGAIGIDGAAHQAALELHVPQLAVLPCGPDRIYPPGHASLFRTMAAAPEAGVLFAHPPGTEPSKGMFFSRNEVIVGLADAVLIAEAALRSGSRKTGTHAQERGRPLAAIAGTSGCAALIGAGAVALPSPPLDGHPGPLVERFVAWLDRVLAPGEEAERRADHWPPHLAWLAAILRAAGPAGLVLDTLDNPDAALVALTEAELLDLVCEVSPGRWRGL